MTLSSKQPTKAERRSSGAPTSTNKKQFFNFYTKVNKDLTSANQKIVKDTIQELITKQELAVTAQNLIINTLRTSCIYFKPKIHKPNNPGRPIDSACSCPTGLISGYLDKVMTPIVTSLASYIKRDQGPTFGYIELHNMTLRGRSIDIYKLSVTAQMRSKPI